MSGRDSPCSDMFANYLEHTVERSEVSGFAMPLDDEKATLSPWRRNSLSDGRVVSAAPSEDSPYSMVRSAVAPRDTHVPSLTFRSVVLGLFFSVALGFANQLLWFKATPITIGGFFVQIVSFPMGYLMSRILPTRKFNTFGYTWTFNPGPFSIKEHAIISIFAASAATSAYSIDILVVETIYYNRPMGFLPAILITLSSLMLGYSYAGLMRELLVYPAAMIWPSSLVSVTLFRTFHEKTSYLHHVSRLRFFWIAFGCMFVYNILPGFVMPVLTFVPALCLAAPNNVIAQQVGDAFHGLGVLNFTFDWSVISSAYFSSPIAIPWYMACNMFAAFVLTMWVITPAAYYSDVWGSGNLPIYSNSIFLANGSYYDTSRVMDAKGHLDPQKYAEYGPIRMPFQFAYVYGLSFAGIVTLVVYTALNHGRDIYNRLRHLNVGDDDYLEVPRWWYAVTLVSMLALGITACEVYGLLPWYYMLLAITISFIFLALSNQQPGLNVITEFLIGYLRAGDPLYGYITMTQTLMLVSDQKLGHYMKIPPRHVFIAQCGVAIWILRAIEGICTTNEVWSCASARTFYSASVIWGLVGPQRLFQNGSPYSPLFYMFLVGAMLPVPVWYLQQRYPNSLWRYVHLPVFFTVLGNMPPAPSASMTSWFFVCFVFQYLIHRYRYGFWQRYAFSLSAALDSGVALSTILIYFVLILPNVHMPDYWGTKTRLCPLAANGGGYKNYQDFQPRT
ncbi:oligopeptide transporter 7-like protein [Linderina pennispora]|uniref:Oligopeptide transporter 7-like protein n=1 Tax=Linderina pennispora TaxID=61395 RepID=A0A1Y1VXI3_9FUNG|nr:oligopeptide transporter 7-like protein [Linderina pennispora]ORX65716.1 oligopeptide transporter 7-like protein [Linderina pennispora]